MEDKTPQTDTPKKEKVTATKENKKDTVLGCFAMIIILVLIVLAFKGCVAYSHYADKEYDKEVAADKAAEAAEKAAKAKEKKLMTQVSEKSVRKAVTKAVGNKTNEDEKYIRKVNIGLGEDLKKKTIVVMLNSNEGWSTKDSLDSMYDDSSKIFKQVRKMKDLETVTLTFYSTFVDKLGNESKDAAMSLTLDKATLAKINFDNFDIDNYRAIAKSSYVHPAMNK